MSVTLIHNLRNPGLYPHPIQKFEIFETHSAWVITTGDFAYKIKKSINLGFLDYSTLDKRKKFCEKELELNQTLARDLYLEVVPIYGTETNPRFSGEGNVLEYAVKMRQFKQENLFSSLLKQGQLKPKIIDDLAEVLVHFHEKTDIAPEQSQYGTPERVHQPTLENFTETIALLKDAEKIAQLKQLAALTETQFKKCLNVFKERKIEGFIRCCHGDPYLQNIVLWNGTPTLFDRIEFNEDFIWTDTMADLGFLLMDLDEQEQPALARLLRNHYMELSGDYHGLQVLPYYSAYRAMVRAKVDQIRLLQENLSAAEIKELTAHYIQSLKLVTHYLSPKKPELIIMFGFAGSGKSTIAKKMVSQIDAVQIRSDAERKRLFDLHRLHDTTSDVKQGLYSSDNTDLVYQYLLLLARYTLKAGYTAIIDATFLKYEHRQWFAALAKELNVPFNIVSCNASVGTLQERIVERNIKQHDISNSTLDVLQHQLETYDPLTEEELTFTTPSATS